MEVKWRSGGKSVGSKLVLHESIREEAKNAGNEVS